MKCRKCGFPMKVEDITRAGRSSIVEYACTNCGTCCTTYKSKKQIRKSRHKSALSLYL